MPSIVDLIAQTEESAEKLKSEAAQKAKTIVSKANDDAEEAQAQAQSDVRRELMLRKENARHTGEKLAQEIMADRKKESMANCAQARKSIDKAVKFIIERLSV